MTATLPRATRPTTARFILILGGLAAFAPLTIDMYLPAMPQIASDLQTTPAQVQLTLTACLIGLAAGQLVAGPLSDTVGRRRPLLIGLALYTAVSLTCAIAPTIWLLISLRLLQALGAAAGVVISRAIVRDLYEGPQLARTFSMLMLVTGTAPILAPIIGAQLLRFTDWRGIFIAFAIFGAVLLLTAAIALPETLPAARRRPLSFRETLKTCGRLLTDRPFITCTISCGLTFAAMFAYIAGASFVLQSPEYGLTPQQFSLVFAANSIGIVAVGQLNARLTSRFSTERLFVIGLAANATGGVALLAAAITGAGLTTMLVTLFVSMASVGMVQPNGTALAMADHPDTAGMASALLGVLQFLIGGLAAPLTGIGGSTSAIPMAMVIAGCGLLALFTFTRR